MRTPTTTYTCGSARDSATPPRSLSSAPRECPPSPPCFHPSGDCLLHTSYSLGACAVAVHVTGDTSSCHILWECWSPMEHLGKGEMTE